MDNEKQHIIPSGYLRAWCTPNPPSHKKGSVWVIQKAAPETKELKSPSERFWLPDRYTIKSNGTRDLSVENTLAAVEDRYAKVIRTIRDRGTIGPGERKSLDSFAAAMLARTEPYAENVESILRTIGKRALKLEQKCGAEPGLSKQVEEHLQSVYGHTASIGMMEYSKMFFRMKLSIFVADDEAGFVTCDAPCFMAVPGPFDLFERPFLGHKDVEVTLPLSPHHLALYSWKIPPVLDRPADRQKVNQANSRTISGCKKEFISWKGTARKEWFGVDYK